MSKVAGQDLLLQVICPPCVSRNNGHEQTRKPPGMAVPGLVLGQGVWKGSRAGCYEQPRKTTVNNDDLLPANLRVCRST
jgi:hypothetical protein